ncbi:MAG: ornithine carbamoyltransferase [Deltaproteobacteria bacterium]|nr:ornithine carbamoyltransferase [Deltaproteobacteria bacterium]
MAKHFLALSDYSSEELGGLLALAAKVKKNPGEYRKALEGQTLGMIFQKSSTRTRVSFEVGMFQLGGHALFLSGNDLQLGRGETVPDTAQVLSRYLDGIMARVFAQKDVDDLATGTIPVINGLSDLLHPCQVMADLQTIQEHKGHLEGLVLTYVGDGNNMAHSLINGGVRMGMEVRIAAPEGYQPVPEIVEAASKLGKVVVDTDAAKLCQGADVVYTDVWASMGQEAEHEARLKLFQPYQVNGELFGKAKDDAIFMHCLPAHRGEEVTDEVVDHARSVVFDEAENRLHAQKAILLHLMGGVAI